MEDLRLEGIDVLQLDVTDASSIQSTVDRVVGEAGGIDLLVCNAGMIRYGPLVEQELSDIKAIFDTNVFGTLLCARAVAPVMIKQRSGIIAASGSISARLTAPFVGAYSASKSATQSLFEGLRVEMSPYNVAVTVIEAGIFRSDLTQKSTLDISKYTAESSLWRQAATRIAYTAKYIKENPTTTAEQVAAHVAKQLCRKQGPPAHFLVGEETWVTKFAGFIYTFISPHLIHKVLAGRFGLDKKW